jgi:TRAP-type C4-dicarboxylate transport system permease small subunit
MKSVSVIRVFVRACSALSVLSLIVMMMVSVFDVVLANLFKRPIVGAFDLVETTLVLTVFLGFPQTFLSNSHIAVDVVDFFVSKAAVGRLKILAKVISIVFLVFLAWKMVDPAADAFKFGERKQELGLPLFALWVPMIFGIAISALVALSSLWGDEDSSPADKEH